MNYLYLVSGIILAIFALAILAIAIIMIIDGDLGSFGVFLFVALLLGGFSAVFFYQNKMTPEKEYQSMLKERDKIDKRIEKFYIDHPEFEVEEVE